MLFVYIISLISSVLFGFSLRSFWAGVFSFMLVLCACDAAVYSAEKGQYVGPVQLIHVVDKAISQVVAGVAVAEKKAAAYEKCVKNLNDKVWNPSQTIPSHRWIHDYCSQQ